jgi:hypothetical protein
VYEKSPPPEKLNELADLLEALAWDLREAARPSFDPTSKDSVLLSGWSLASRDVLALTGRVEDHPKLGTTFMRTSAVFFLDTQSGWARTLSRWYRLGEPAGDWRKQ